MSDSSDKSVTSEKPPVQEAERAEKLSVPEPRAEAARESSSVVNERAWKNPGHFEMTSEDGKPKSVEGWLSTGAGERSAADKQHQREVVPDARQSGRDAGHLIGHSIGGPSAESHGETAKDNLIPMDSRVNRSQVGCLERHLTDQMNSGKSVYMKAEVNYTGEGESRRPESVTYGWAVRDNKNGDPPAKLTETPIRISERPDRTLAQTMEPAMGQNGTSKARDWFDESRKGTIGGVN